MATPSQSLEEKYESAMKDKAEKEAQLEYLRKQVAQLMRRNRRTFQGSNSLSNSHSEEEGSAEHTLKASSGEEDSREPRRTHGRRQTSMDFKVEIPEFEGQLNPDEFIDWLNTVERVRV